MNIEIRLCEQTLCCAYAFGKRVPRAASASTFGVFATGLPDAPMQSARSWSGMKRSRFGLGANATPSARCGARDRSALLERELGHSVQV